MSFKFATASIWVFIFFFINTNLVLTASTAETGHNPDYVNALWLADKAGILKITTEKGQRLLQIKGIRKISVDNKNGVLWVTRKSTLEKYSFNGAILSASPYQTVNHKKKSHSEDDEVDDDAFDIKILRIDPNDGTVWLATETSLYHYNTDATLINSKTFDDEIHGKIKAIALIPNQAQLWLATEHSLMRYPASLDNMNLKVSLSIDRREDDADDLEIEHISYDAWLEQLWVATEKQLIRLDAQGSIIFSTRQKKINDLLADGKGRLWISLKKELRYIKKEGAELIRINPFNKGDKKYATCDWNQRINPSGWQVTNNLFSSTSRVKLSSVLR